MKTREIISFGVSALVGFAIVAILAFNEPAQAQQRSRTLKSPQPTSTPQVDAARLNGVIQPSAAPTCGVGKAGFYGDPNGCLYGCADQRVVTIARPLNGSACVFPTTGATATP